MMIELQEYNTVIKGLGQQLELMRRLNRELIEIHTKRNESTDSLLTEANRLNQRFFQFMRNNPKINKKWMKEFPPQQ